MTKSIGPGSKNHESNKVTKTYFITREYDNRFPPEFINSLNDRYISFQYCRATCNGYLDGETEVHASFVPRDEYCDDNRKYKYTLNHDRFKNWFTDSTGNEIVPDNFTLFLKLQY